MWAFLLTNFHELKFLGSPEILALAKARGIDMSDLESYAGDYIPTMDLYISVREGDAEIMHSEIITKIPSLQNNKFAQRCYKFLALIQTLSSPYAHQRQMAYFVGTGLCEYLRNHPEQRDFVMNSGDFHRQLSEEFFSLPMTKQLKGNLRGSQLTQP